MTGLPPTGQRGFILLPVVLALGLVAAAAYLMNREGSLQAHSAAGEFQAAEVRYVAEAGLEHARWVADHAACTGYALPPTPFGAHSYQASFTPSAGSPVAILATGTLASGVQRATERSVRVFENTTTTETFQRGTGSASVEDTRVKSDLPTRNWGGAVSLEVSAEDQSLLWFDLSLLPQTARIQSASLTLTAGVVTSPGEISVHRITTPWEEGTCDTSPTCVVDGATWNTRDGSTPWVTAGPDHDPAAVASQPVATSGPVVWDVSDLVGDWVERGVTNDGMLLRAGPGVVVKLNSSENLQQAARPTLSVTYACECGGSTGSGTLTLEPGPEGVDTYLADGTPATNFGGDTEIRLSNKTNSQKRGLVAFPIPSLPVGATLTSAVLELYLLGIGSGSAGDVFVHQATTPWSESGATWVDAAAGDAWGTSGGDYDPLAVASTGILPLNPGPVQWTVTPLVASWIDGSVPNQGFFLMASPDVNHADFSTSDVSVPTQRPRLTLTWACPCGAACDAGALSGVYLDTFDTATCDPAIDYAGSDGTLDWSASPWTEYGDSGEPCAGASKLVDDGGTFAARFQQDGKGYERSADLSSFTSVRLTLRYRRVDLESGENLSVQISDDGGSNFTEVSQIQGNGTDLSYRTESFDLSSYAGSQIVVRLVPAGFVSDPGGDFLYLSELRIDSEPVTGGPGGPTLSPDADTYIEESRSNNYGGDPTFEVGRSGGPGRNLHGWLHFDVSSIPLASMVSSATLRVHASASSGSASYNVGAHRADQSWTEMGANWDTADGTLAWSGGPGGTFTATPVDSLPAGAQGWYEWDVATLVQEWVDGNPNHGIALVHTAVAKGNRLTFDSREGGNPPELVVVLAP